MIFSSDIPGVGASGAIFGFVIPSRFKDFIISSSKAREKMGGDFMILGSGDIGLPLIMVCSLVPISLNAAMITGLFSLTGLFFSLLMSKKQQMLSRPEAMHLHLGVELSHWAKLFKAVWPMMIIFLLIGLVDAVFWTSGIVLSNNLGKEDVLGKFIVPLYVMPSMLAGTMIARWHPSDKKKKYGTIFFIVSAVFLSLIGFTYNIKLVLLLVGISSVFSSLAYPLIDAVFSDFTQRMGKERFHLIGLTNSAGSIAYIVGPILSGLIASFVGEQMTFSVIGIFVLLVSLFILFITPRKILLPQGDIKNWD